jgi:hypothetical protein
MFGSEKRVLAKHYLDQGLSQAAVADLLGITRRTLHRWRQQGMLDGPVAERKYVRRPQPTKLDAYKSIIEERLTVTRSCQRSGCWRKSARQVTWADTRSCRPTSRRCAPLRFRRCAAIYVIVFRRRCSPVPATTSTHENYLARATGHPRHRARWRSHRFPSGKALALLAYLSLKDRPCTRDELGRLLWSASGRERRQQSVRQALWLIRRLLGDDLLQGEDPIRPAPGAITTDVLELRNACAEACGERVERLWRGRLLEHFVLPSAPEWDMWLEEERGQLDRLAGSALHAAAVAALEQGDPTSAIRWLTRAIAIEPQHWRRASPSWTHCWERGVLLRPSRRWPLRVCSCRALSSRPISHTMTHASLTAVVPQPRATRSRC